MHHDHIPSQCIILCRILLTHRELNMCKHINIIGAENWKQNLCAYNYYNNTLHNAVSTNGKTPDFFLFGRLNLWFMWVPLHVFLYKWHSVYFFTRTNSTCLPMQHLKCIFLRRNGFKIEMHVKSKAHLDIWSKQSFLFCLCHRCFFVSELT